MNRNDFDHYYGLERQDAFSILPEAADRILDLGGGAGATALAVKSQLNGACAGVIDINPLAVSKAENTLDFAFLGDIEKENLIERAAEEYGPFDLILCLDVLEHLVDPWRVVKRLHNVLAPDGYIVASIPNVRHYSVAARLVLEGTWELQDSGILDRTHLRFFVRSTAVGLMTSSGLLLEVIESTGLHWRRKTRLFNRLTFGLFEGLLVPQYLIRVRNVS